MTNNQWLGGLLTMQESNIVNTLLTDRETEMFLTRAQDLKYKAGGQSSVMALLCDIAVNGTEDLFRQAERLKCKRSTLRGLEVV